MRKSRGQVFTTDYIIGVAVFVIIFSSCVLVWEKTIYCTQEDFLINEMIYTAKRASQQVVRSPGIPLNWEDDVGSIEAIGLAIGDRVLSPRKFRGLAAMDYGLTKHYLGMGGHEFYMRIENSTGSLIGEAGRRPTGDIVVNVRRIAVMDNKSVVLDLSVWGSYIPNSAYPV